MVKVEIKEGYYRINGNKVLYWQENEWWEPVKYINRYTGTIRRLEKQPKRIKSIEAYQAAS